MSQADAVVVVAFALVAVAYVCIFVWAPFPYGCGVRRPTFTRHFWLYPRPRRARGIV